MNRLKKHVVPVRMCAGCRLRKPKSDLFRIVGTEDIHYDPTGKEDGRGMYVCRDKSCIDRLAKMKKGHARIPPHVADALRENLPEADCE